MAGYDIDITPDTSGDVVFSVRGRSADCGRMLLQRLYVLMLSDMSGMMRGDGGGCDLLELLDGGNTPPDPVLTSVLGIACTSAVHALDDEDRALVASFTAAGTDGCAECTLVLTDGTTVTGRI